MLISLSLSFSLFIKYETLIFDYAYILPCYLSIFKDIMRTVANVIFNLEYVHD